MTTADGEETGGGDKSRFRWLDAARYVVAAAMTVLILAVIVNAIKVVLRLDSLQISVDKGSVFTTPSSLPAAAEAAFLALKLELRAQNPSGRVRMYFLGVSTYLFDSNTSASASANPEFDSIIAFHLNDMAVLQQEALDSVVSTKLHKEQMAPDYFAMLYNGSSFGDMTLRLDGNLVTEVTSEFNKTRPTTYYCEELLVGGNPDGEAFKNRQEVICKQRRTP